jgi:hypothetical protein
VTQILDISAYRFTPLSDTAALRESIRSQAGGMGLKGTVLLAEEGINLSRCLARPGDGSASAAASAQLHAQAEQRAQGLRAQGWQIDLQCARAESVKLPARPDAALSHCVHDIVRTPQAVANLFAQLPPGTRLAIAGMKYFPWWLAPFNLPGWLQARHRHKPAHELREPWSLVQAHPKDFRWKSTQGGTGHVGSGRVKGAGL